jgi:L-seryl-tRNA(Ser) seleniumtransferase
MGIGELCERRRNDASGVDQRSDYADAVGPRTALLLKVHTSNYEMRGFVSNVGIDELAGLARERALPLAVDPAAERCSTCANGGCPMSRRCGRRLRPALIS